MRNKTFFYVYILLCSDGSYYTGVTSNLWERLNQHESGKYPQAYTASRLPVELVFYTTFTNAQTAFDYETKIKKWSRAKKLALINEEYHKLPALAKKKFRKKC